MASEPRGSLQVQLSALNLTREDRPVLRDVDWRISSTQRWALVGGNGAGKTQLLKLIAGDVWPDADGKRARRYLLDGERFDEPNGVKQEIAYLGPERQDRYERYGWNFPVEAIIGTGIHRTDIPLHPLGTTHLRRIAALLRSLQIAHLATRPFLSLSYGERRLVLFARALAWRPRLLLLDEPTNGLDEMHRAALLRQLESAISGPGWIFSSHRAEDLPGNAGRLLILRRGRVAWRGPLTPQSLRRAFGGKAQHLDAASTSRPVRKRTARMPVLLALRNASIYLDAQRDAPTLAHLTMDIRRGDCWVVHGGNGAGKSTLLRTLYGDMGVASDGSITRRSLAPGEPIEVFKRTVGLIAPHLQAEQPQEITVLRAAVSGLHASIGLNEAPDALEIRRARASLKRFGLERFAARPLRELSYGQMRRVLFARAWVNEPSMLLLDEPFAGIDTPTRNALLAALDSLLATGLTIIIATHHRSEWPAATTHELELEAGRVVYCAPVRR
ncbi:MAG: ATP-binding cassette domain-containing protein [Steroidobacteraceae bacterium]